MKIVFLIFVLKIRKSRKIIIVSTGGICTSDRNINTDLYDDYIIDA